MKNLHKLYQFFLESPYLNGCLVFDEKNYCGVLLRKDLELALNSKDDFIIDKISKIPFTQLEEIIFNTKPSLKMKIPYISMMGETLGVLLYNEFVSEFFTEDYRLSHTEIMDYLEHPILIVNQFKTILYLNRSAKDLLSEKVFGMKFSKALGAFEIGFEEDKIVISRQNEQWILKIIKSPTPFAEYFVYQFIKKHP